MYGRNATQVEGYNKSGKSNMQPHASVSNQLSSSSQHTESKHDSLHRQKLAGKNALSQKGGMLNHSSKTSNEKAKHHKIQGALRSCGNWSEHVSSSGKKYFYNNVSEISQWEKPKEWDDTSAVDLKAKEKAKVSAQRSNSKSHHRSSHSTSASKPATNNDTDRDYRHRKDFCDKDYRTKQAITGDRDYRDIDYRDAVSKNSDSKNSLRRSISTDKDYRSLNSVNSGVKRDSNGQVSTKQESYRPSTGEFYDYSSWNNNGKPSTDSKTVNGGTGSKENTQANQPSTETAAPEIEQLPNSSKTDESSLTALSSEFVKKLSSVLNQAAASANDDMSKSEGNIQDVFQLLMNAAAKSQNEKETQNEPSRDVTTDDSNDPPSKRICLENTTEKADVKKEPSDNSDITPTISDFKSIEDLRSFFDPSSILHVQNWPAEQNEKQCQRLSEDYHRFVADHMSELNVQLTNARSRVRASEILSTLQEQRILYIRQQVKDLERSSSASGPFT